MGDEKGAEQDGDPKLAKSRQGRNVVFQRGEIADKRGRPDLRAVLGGHDHHRACDNQTLCAITLVLVSFVNGGPGAPSPRLTCGAVEVSKIKGMGVICFPSGEEHGQARNQGSESARLGCAVSHCRSLEQAGESAVERVDSMAAAVLATL